MAETGRGLVFCWTRTPEGRCEAGNQSTGKAGHLVTSVPTCAAWTPAPSLSSMVGSRKREVQQPLPTAVGAPCCPAPVAGPHAAWHTVQDSRRTALRTVLFVLELMGPGSKRLHTTLGHDPWHVTCDRAARDMTHPQVLRPCGACRLGGTSTECAVTKREGHPRGLMDLGVTNRLP